jgi:hypothetical protein
MMRRLAGSALSLAVLSMALGGCGDDTGLPVTRAPTGAPSPSVTPGTRPTSASPSVSASSSDSDSTQAVPGPTSAEESLTPSPSDATTTPPVDVEVAPVTLVGYRALSDAMNGFYAKAFRVADQHPHADPTNAQEIKALVNYKFPEGVDLVEYSDPEEDPGATGRMCFLGPEDTHLVLGSVDDDLRQMLGTGGCRYDDGDVIVDLSFDFADDDSSDLSFVWSATVVKGANIAAQIPGLNDFLGLLNASR